MAGSCVSLRGRPRRSRRSPHMHATRRRAIATFTAAVVVLTALAAGAQARPDTSANHKIQIGIVYSRTGAFSAYGAEYLSGLRYGLEYATGGTGKVAGHEIEFTLV